MNDDRRLRSTITADDWTLGPDDADVTLLEYGDLQCPECGRAYPETKAALAALGDRVRFVFRHFPLASLHPRAQAAAQAAEAAGAQGRFWEMADLLLTHQSQLDDEDLRRYAEQLGLDLDRFDHELRTEAYRDQVRQHRRAGIGDGVNGTPTFYVNGLRYDGPYDRADLIAVLRAALNP